MNPSFLLKKVDNMVRQLALETDEAKRSDFFKAYLEMVAIFWQYSWRNQLLILAQFPSASRVAGFRAWNELGRHVVKGSKAIRVLAPFVKRVVEEDKETNEKKERALTYFVPVCVFDVSQTEGKPLPSLDLELKGDNQKGLLDSLLAYCQKLGVEVEFRELGVNGLYGYAKKGKIMVASNQSVNSRASTLLHEIAHVLLHQGNNVTSSKQAKEIQAEGVAFVVAKTLGFESKAPNYLALYDADYKKVLESMEAISGTASQILNHLGGALLKGAPGKVCKVFA